MTSSPIDSAFNSRAEQRKKKLLDIEREQQQEELEALKMTEEQLHLLKRSFMSVKFEFYDLDGQRWTPSALYTRQYRAKTSWNATRFRKESPVNKIEIYETFSEDTVRVPSRKPKTTPSTIITTAGHNSLFTATPIPSPNDTLTFQYNHRDGARQRSPVKGLFQSAIRDVDMNVSDAGQHLSVWNTPETPRPHDSPPSHYHLACPPSPICPSLGSFGDAYTYQAGF